MTEHSELSLAEDCFRRAARDVETWLNLVTEGQLATLAPFGQMFVYQLRSRGKLEDRAFAVDALYRLYYRKAEGKGDPPDLGASRTGIARP